MLRNGILDAINVYAIEFRPKLVGLK